MKTIIYPFLCFQLLCVINSSHATAQEAIKNTTASNTQGARPATGLFDNDKILELKLSGNTRELLKDRGEKPTYHALSLFYRNDDSTEIALPVKVKTRGHFRKLKSNCIYPPLAINFQKSDAKKSSIFQKQDKIKLVMPCRGEEFIIREWLVYKLYNLVTPKSFRARLVSLKLENTTNNKSEDPFYGILLEEESQMSKRNKMVSVDKKLRPEQTDHESFITMAVFQYLIGNTDWSVQYLQNMKLIASDLNSVPIAVAYDFDHSGMVNAPYAHPAEELLMSSVKERRYRGFCITDMKRFDPVIALFNQLKKDIYSLYSECTLLDEKYLKTTIKYLDEFYETINDAEKLKREFGYPCDKNGTGNVVIKGLRED